MTWWAHQRTTWAPERATLRPSTRRPWCDLAAPRPCLLAVLLAGAGSAAVWRTSDEPRRDRVVSIEPVGPVTAVARVECSIGNKRFDDVLTLVCVDGRGQIIAKVFHYDVVEAA